MSELNVAIIMCCSVMYGMLFGTSKKFCLPIISNYTDNAEMITLVE